MEQAIGHALTWLAKFPLEIEARFVLAPLLHRQELTGANLDLAVSYAIDWLADYLDTEDAEFLLKRLLPRSPLPEGRIRVLKQLAVNQLRIRVKDVDDEGVSFLFRPWLHCRVRHADLDHEIVLLACDWLRANLTREGIDFVFNRILRQKDLPDSDWLVAAQIASDWLSTSKRSFRDTDFAVNSLLTRSSIAPHPVLVNIIRRGHGLLKNMPNPKEREHLKVRLRRALESLPVGDPLLAEAGILLDKPD